MSLLDSHWFIPYRRFGLCFIASKYFIPSGTVSTYSPADGVRACSKNAMRLHRRLSTTATLPPPDAGLPTLERMLQYCFEGIVILQLSQNLEA
jgi:hypothetical protein